MIISQDQLPFQRGERTPSRTKTPTTEFNAGIILFCLISPSKEYSDGHKKVAAGPNGSRRRIIRLRSRRRLIWLARGWKYENSKRVVGHNNKMLCPALVGARCHVAGTRVYFRPLAGCAIYNRSRRVGGLSLIVCLVWRLHTYYIAP